MRNRNPLIALVVAGIATIAGVVTAETENRFVSFQGRQIDLKPYFDGFPYSGFTPVAEADRIYYYHEGDTRTLREVRLGKDPNLEKGRIISDVDFSKRNVWGIQYNKHDRHLYWIGDEKNDEVINLWRLNPENKELTKITDVPYIFGWRWDRDKKRVAYVARTGQREERQGEIRLRSLETGVEQVIYQDEANMRLTWTNVSWQEYGKGFVVTVLKDADRNLGNIAYMDLETRKFTILTDPSTPRNWPTAIKEWVSPTEFVFTSNEDGYRNAWKANIASGHVMPLTHFTRDIGSAEIFGFNGHRYLVCILEGPVDNEFVLVDPHSGEILAQQTVPLNIEILDVQSNKFFVSATSATVKLQIGEARIDPRGDRRYKSETLLSIPAELESQILHSTVEKVEIPTFDQDATTGTTRKLHAFLYTPKKPMAKDQQLVMIQSYYGGGNNWSTGTQILADAGIYVVSPSPRGSSGFGREFAALNDKDLGGNEILDVIYVGKWAQETLGVPAERIGVYGGSHGGYATMRLLTFPGEINGVKADFNWGFGISHAGFSDIIHFYEHCNIPDWVILEAGDPGTEADKLKDRSPLYHADMGRGMLLLTHGTNDSRVPIEGSRVMADSLRAHGKQVTLVEFEGQGHGIKGLDNQVRNYKAWFAFLETVTGGDRASN